MMEASVDVNMDRCMEAISTYWPQITALVVFLIWVVRLEGLVKSVAEKINRIEIDRNIDVSSVQNFRAETSVKFDRLDDKLDSNFREVRNDIKNLIRKGTDE
jgi:low affinity Fe/Cu permease